MPDDPLARLAEEIRQADTIDPSIVSDSDVVRRAEMQARVHSFADLLYQEPEYRDPLLGPLVRRGWRTMIAGHTGEGKSTMIGRIVKAVMTGDEFFGWKGIGEAKVLVIDLEQDLVIAQRRMIETWYPGKWDEKMTAAEMTGGEIHPGMNSSFYCRWSEGLGLNSSEIDRMVLEEIIEKVQPDLVVFDPLYKGFEGDPNDQQLATAVMRILDGWRERYGFGLLIGAHMRKPLRQGGSFSKHDVSASGAWIFGAEIVLGVRRLQGNAGGLYFFKDRAGDLPVNDHWMFTYTPEKGYRRSALDASSDETKIPAHERIWRLLQNFAGQDLTRAQIGDLLGIESPKTVRAATETLVERNPDGLRVQKGVNSTLLYSYAPPEKRLTLDALNDIIDEAEDSFQ